MLVFVFFSFALIISMVFNFSLWVYMIFMVIFFPLFFFFNFSFSFLSKSYFLCFDFFSFSMLLLTFWIVMLSMFSSFHYLEVDSSLSMFVFLYWMIKIFLIMFFVLSNFFFFFFFFESILFPIFFIILGWGNNFERVFSGYYLFFYTLFSSIPMLLSIFFFSSFSNSLFFFFMDIDFFFFFLYFLFLFSFLVKFPMFLVHSWLPKAHVEAPVSGSMILAGVLLKMGGYGIFRLFFFFEFFYCLNIFWIYISIWGGILSGFICLRQVDLKSLIAFSSVSHMSLVIMGFFSFKGLGVYGGLMMMVSHGLCSSGLFYLVNMVYERSGTRSILLNKGLMSVYPSFSFFWFLMCISNMSAPPSLNLFSEIFLISSLVAWSFIFIFFFIFFCFLNGAFNLYLFSSVSHGKLNSIFFFFNSCCIREYLIIFFHIFPIFFFFMKIEFFL
uniref:NADH dehydrogenase subunit 4 n=1 Tax=Bregmatothrips sinensis TaxID=3045418 RepID=UPI0030E184D3